MTVTPAGLRDLPLPARFAIMGAAVLGVPAAIAGGVIGLVGYPPTAWAAMVELGLPAALVGAALGVAVAAVARGLGRPRR